MSVGPEATGDPGLTGLGAPRSPVPLGSAPRPAACAGQHRGQRLRSAPRTAAPRKDTALGSLRASGTAGSPAGSTTAPFLVREPTSPCQVPVKTQYCSNRSLTHQAPGKICYCPTRSLRESMIAPRTPRETPLSPHHVPAAAPQPASEPCYRPARTQSCSERISVQPPLRSGGRAVRQRAAIAHGCCTHTHTHTQTGMCKHTGTARRSLRAGGCPGTSRAAP